MQLEMLEISKRFDGVTVLGPVTLAVPDFRCLAVIGPSGGGKTTLLRIIAGLAVPDSGSLILNGEELKFDEALLLAHRRSVGTVFQAYNLFPHLTALDNVMLPLVRVHSMAPAAAKESALALLERFQLLPHAGKRPAELSGGQQQRVAIVRALAIKPRFLLFDEPTSALDPEMTAEVLDCIAELRHEGRDFIIVTHNMGFARKVADRCLFVSGGEVVESGVTEDLFGDPQTPLLASFLAKILRY